MRKIFGFLIFLLIVGLVVGLAYREAEIRGEYPVEIRHYAEISKTIATPEMGERIREYVKDDAIQLHSIENPKFFVDYVHSKVTYTETKIARHEDPIEIMEYGKGRCGEFSILFTAICLAYGYEARMVICLSDHVWSEVMVNGTWVHVDPTEGFWDFPQLYEVLWGKDFSGGQDKALALENGTITDISGRYIFNKGEEESKQVFPELTEEEYEFKILPSEQRGWKNVH